MAHDEVWHAVGIPRWWRGPLEMFPCWCREFPGVCFLASLLLSAVSDFTPTPAELLCGYVCPELPNWTVNFVKVLILILLFFCYLT